jgi:hypothetical protein
MTQHSILIGLERRRRNEADEFLDRMRLFAND